MFLLLVDKVLVRNGAMYTWSWNDKAEESFLTESSTKGAGSLASPQSHRPQMLTYKYQDADHIIRRDGLRVVKIVQRSQLGRHKLSHGLDVTSLVPQYEFTNLQAW